MRYGYGGVQRNTVEDFWEKVEIKGSDDCWPWKEGRWHNGYGRFKWNYQSWRAHRFALLSIGELPSEEGLLVRHSCQNRICCNPSHLVWGTQKANMKDRWTHHFQRLSELKAVGLTSAKQEVSLDEWNAKMEAILYGTPS